MSTCDATFSSLEPPPRGVRAQRAPTVIAFACAIAAFLVALGCGAAASAAAPWQWPVDPARVVNEFTPPDNPYGAGHRGVDLAAAVGQAVLAPAAGTVTFAGVIAGRGVVVVSHGDVRTTYEPVVAEVDIGAVVDAGELIATVSPFGFHCSTPCLHWGALRGDTYVDPTSFVLVKPSRLLPLWGGSARSGAAQNGVVPPTVPVEPSAGAVESMNVPAAPSGPIDSPGAGDLQGVGAGAGALSTYGDATARRTASAPGRGLATQLGSGSQPSARAVDSRFAVLLVIASGATLLGCGRRWARRRT